MSSSAFALIRDTFQARIGIWKCWFLRRGENRSTRGKTSRSREENQQQTQPTYDAGSGNQTRDTLVGGECSHQCAIPSPCLPVTLIYTPLPIPLNRSKPRSTLNNDPLLLVGKLEEVAWQWLGHKTWNPEVAGSSLSSTTKLRWFLGRL